MKKALAAFVALCLGFGLAGCSGNYTTVKRPGYSFEVNSNWEIEEYSTNSLFIYPDKKSPGITMIHVYESDRTGFPYKSLEDQYDSILNIRLADENLGGGVTVKHSNIVKDKIGDNAYVTADKITSGPYATEYARVLCFCPSPEKLVIIEFSSDDKNTYNKYKKDIDRLFKSAKPN